jgi:hypothetical protein
MLWSTQSKALRRSQKIPPAIILVFNDFKIPSINLKEAFSGDAPGLKPNCSVAKMPL